jgi:hypothetical protein
MSGSESLSFTNGVVTLRQNVTSNKKASCGKTDHDLETIFGPS